jgi:hypothetical protein
MPRHSHRALTARTTALIPHRCAWFTRSTDPRWKSHWRSQGIAPGLQDASAHHPDRRAGQGPGWSVRRRRGPSDATWRSRRRPGLTRASQHGSGGRSQRNDRSPESSQDWVVDDRRSDSSLHPFNGYGPLDPVRALALVVRASIVPKQDWAADPAGHLELPLDIYRVYNVGMARAARPLMCSMRWRSPGGARS